MAGHYVFTWPDIASLLARYAFNLHRNLLQFACEDLKALKSVVQVVEDQKDWQYEREMLAVVLRSLGSIISDMEEGIESISEELKT